MIKPRFSIKSLLVAAVTTAMALGWWIDRGRLIKELNAERSICLEQLDSMQRRINFAKQETSEKTIIIELMQERHAETERRLRQLPRP